MPRVSGMGRSLIWSFLEQGSSKLIALIVQIVLARLLSPETFGILAILLVVTNIADSIAQSGLGMALIQKSDSDNESFSTAWWLSLAIAVALYLIIVLIAPTVAAFYEMPELINYLKVLGLVVITNSANSIQRSFMQRKMDFRGIFRISLTAIILSGIIGIIAAYAGLGVWALIAQSLAQSILTCIVMLIVVPWKPTVVFNAEEAKGLFCFGWKVCITGILNVLYTGISELVIGRACSAESLGYYSQGRKYPQAAIGVMSNAIANVLFPAFSAIKDDRDALRQSLKKSLALGSFIIVPFSLACAVVAEPLVAILLTEKWLPCVLIFQLTCISNALLMLQLVNLRAYMALGDSLLYLRLQIIKVLVGGVAIWMTAIVSRDIYATAITTFLVGVFAIIIVDMYPAKRLHGYSRSEQLADQAPIFALATVSAIASYALVFTGLPYIPLLVIQLLVYTVIYFLGAKLFKFKELEYCVARAKRLMSWR